MMLDSDIRSKIVRIGVHAGVFSVFINVLTLTTPLYLLQVYDRVLSSFSLETLLYLSLIAGAALLFLGAMEVARSMYFQRLATVIDRQFGPEAVSIALRAGEIGQLDAQPMRDLGTVRSFIAGKGLATLFDLPFAPLFVLILYLIHPVLFWLTLGGLAFLLMLAILNQIGIRDAAAAASDRTAAANANAMAFASNAETIRAMGMRRGVVEAWGKTFAESAQANDHAFAINAAFSGVSRTIRMGLQIAILGVGAWLVLGQEMTPGMIFASAVISGRAMQPIDMLIGSWRNVVDARHAWSRLTGMMARTRKPQSRKVLMPELRGHVAVHGLTYAPPGGAAIVRRVSFTTEPGEVVAIIGPSRAGKTTLARLIVGALTPTSGEVRIDGTEIANWDDAQLGRGIGYMSQDVQLIAGTIAENISRFDPEVDDKAVTDAAMRAHAHDMIISLPASYQTQISAVSATLSGGEKQRIGLARAFYGSPRILVLDEPNANLDADGEAALEKAIANAREAGSTVFIVTHRLSIAASCDRILELRQGEVTAFGPSQQVLQSLSRGSGAVVPINRGANTPRPVQTAEAERQSD